MLYATVSDRPSVAKAKLFMRNAVKSRPRTKPPEERRVELMNSAQRLFLEQGVGATTIEQITSGADVAKGTFYLYFSSREKILAALRERFVQEFLAGIKTAIAERPKEDWRGKLATWAKASVTGYFDSMQLHDVVFYETPPPVREGRTGLVDNIVIDHLFELLQGGMEAGAWSIDDPRFTAVFLFNGLHGVVDEAYSRDRRVSRSRLAHRSERLCFRAVGLVAE
jgi:AcrR family transcriptional regulator